MIITDHLSEPDPATVGLHRLGPRLQLPAPPVVLFSPSHFDDFQHQSGKSHHRHEERNDDKCDTRSHSNQVSFQRMICEPEGRTAMADMAGSSRVFEPS